MPTTCNDCYFARALQSDLTQIECGGVSPTPVCFGFQQTAPLALQKGPPQPVLKCVPPVLPRTYPACAMFRPKSLHLSDVIDPLHVC